MVNKLKFALGVFALFPCIANADALDDKIAELTHQKLDKIAQLEQCQKSTKGLKIAGITTLGISTIGIAANIGEAVKIKKLDDELSSIETQKKNLKNKIDAAQKEQEQKKAAALVALVAAEEDDDIKVTIPNCGTQTCAEWSDTELLTLNATDSICVSGIRKPVSCYSGEPIGPGIQCKNGDKIITYYNECQTETTSTPPPTTTRKYHEICSADETAAIPHAKTSWWYIDKCVPQSCQDGTYLTVKGGNSQGICRTRCQAHQITDWPHGGKACDITKQATAPVAAKTNCNRTEISISGYKSGICDSKCSEHADSNNCNITKSIYMLNKNKCICNPTVTDEMANASEYHRKQDTEIPPCPEKLYQRINPYQCENLCKNYASEKNCKIINFGTVLTNNCYCNPSSTVTLD